MEELIKRLRYCSNAIFCTGCPYWKGCGGSKENMIKAADAIENLDYIAQTYAETVHELEEQNRWISVTDRLPEEGVPVLACFYSGGGIDQTVCEWFADNRNQMSWVYWLGGLCSEKPTYWMPLPSAPTEET